MRTKLNSTFQNIEPPALREVSLKVAAVKGINLGQGVCRMPVPPEVIESARTSIASGQNLYSPAQGIPELLEALVEKFRCFNKISYSTENILVTQGATGAFEAACEVLLSPGDEVLSFRPHYPYHHNALSRRGIAIKYIDLVPPSWDFSKEALTSAITSKTKFILINTPNNPTGKVFSKSELEFVASLCIKHDLLCITDEVYEYMTYDGLIHTSIASLDGMKERCITMGSYSKTFAITGWRIGYLAAPTLLIPALRAAADQLYVCAPTPFQYAVAHGISKLPNSYYTNRCEEYKKKRDLMKTALLKGGFEPHIPQGAYYMLADISKKFPGKTANQVTDHMINTVKVGAVPASDFVGEQAKTNPRIGNFFRFAFAVPDEMLIEAGNLLSELN